MDGRGFMKIKLNTSKGNKKMYINSVVVIGQLLTTGETLQIEFDNQSKPSIEIRKNKTIMKIAENSEAYDDFMSWVENHYNKEIARKDLKQFKFKF